VYPEDLRFTPEHEWVRLLASGNVAFGITHFAQEALGDIVYVSLPKPGSKLVAGDSCGEVESTKSVSDIYAPVTGHVVASNAELDDSPETVNTDPYNSGWMVEVRPEDPSAIEGLLTADAYRDLVEKSA
jgi:glycine cleavage system H protein